MKFFRRAPLLIWLLALCAAQCIAAAARAANDNAAARVLLIVHAADLRAAAEEWSAYRQSEQGGNWRVVLHEVAESGDANTRRHDVQQFIRGVYKYVSPADDAGFAVLLLGDTDSKTQSGIPAWYFPQSDSVMRSGDGTNDEFASDDPYQLLDDADSAPQAALGRVPARNNQEARAVLEKIKQYEAPPTVAQLASADRMRITYVAGEGRFGAMDGVLETLFKQMVDRLVPPAFDFSMTYAKASSVYCPPPSKLSEVVLDRLNRGGLLFNYIGHGYAKGLDSLHWAGKRFPILSAGDLRRAAERHNEPAVNAAATTSTAPQPTPAAHLAPIAFLSCCSTGWFDLPGGERSFAEELLFNPAGCGGAIAVIAGSRITHPYANTVMQMNITKSLLIDRAATVGLLDLRAKQAMLAANSAVDRQLDGIAAPIARVGKWETSLAELRKMHAKLYNLLGDPATRIALPATQVANLNFENGTITGEISGMKTGHAMITIETVRTSFAQPENIQLLAGDNDPELERKAMNNAAIVNHRVLNRVEARIVDGKFAADIANLINASSAIVRVVAVGEDASNRALDAVGALHLPPAEGSLTAQ